MKNEFLFDRQRVLLAVLGALDDAVPHTDFQKLLFLYSQEWETKPSYDFVPYHFGGFSFTSYADKRRLIDRGLLADTDHHWKLTDAGRMASQKNATLRDRAARFMKQYQKLRTDALIAEVYRRYPYYATRSRIVSRILKIQAERDAVDAAKPVPRGAGLVTIGYEGKTLEAYLNQLLRDTVTLLCDVRRNPISRKYGFSKKTLAHACEGIGIRYEHLPELGISSEERRDLETQADYDSLFDEYEKKSLPHQNRALASIRGWINGGERVALTCYEALPCQCHRHCVAEALESESGKKLRAVHL